MKRVLGVAALAVVASVVPVRGEEGGVAEPPRAVARDRLPVLGTVGDLPPASERIEAEVLPEPALVVGGRRVDLPGFLRILEERSDGFREEAPPRASRLHVVIRADRDVRWQDVQWVMQACADPAVRIHRVLFAAVPEDGGEEGAMATYLPCDAGPGESAESETPVHLEIPVRLLAGGTSATAAPGATVFAHFETRLAKAKPQSPVATVDADPSVSTGAVLEAVDALLRWGVKGVTFRGTSVNASVRAQARFGAAVDRPRVVVLQAAAGAPAEGDPRPPSVARVRGRLAGQTEPPPVAATTAPVPAGSVGAGGGTGGMFGGRRGGKPGLKTEGGTGTDEFVVAGLEWLKDHQSPGGFWDCDGFEAMCKRNRCGGAGGPLFDPGATGLALLAFLGYGETHNSPRYGHVVRHGLKYLKGIQDPEGCFGPRTSQHFVYNHALASLAVIEAYGLTQSPLFKSSAQNGVNFILKCRNPGRGWRYGVRPRDNDTSITACMVLALHAARGAGLDVEEEAFEGARAWLDLVTEPVSGRAGYTAKGNGPARPHELRERFPADRTESLTAAAVLTRLLCGEGRDSDPVRKGADLCRRSLPKWDRDAGTIDYYYWYFGTLAMFQVGDAAWREWNGALRDALLPNQRREPGDDRRGSWDPVDPWASEGGRVYSTAMSVLALETYYRYARTWR